MNYTMMIWTNNNYIVPKVWTAPAKRLYVVGFSKWFVIFGSEIHPADLTPVIID